MLSFLKHRAWSFLQKKRKMITKGRDRYIFILLMIENAEFCIQLKFLSFTLCNGILSSNTSYPDDTYNNMFEPLEWFAFVIKLLIRLAPSSCFPDTDLHQSLKNWTFIWQSCVDVQIDIASAFNILQCMKYLKRNTTREAAMNAWRKVLWYVVSGITIRMRKLLSVLIMI